MEEVGSAVGMLMAGMPELRGTAGVGAPDKDSCIQTRGNPAACNARERKLRWRSTALHRLQMPRAALSKLMRTDNTERGQLKL